jgi:hypothetical protein
MLHFASWAHNCRRILLFFNHAYLLCSRLLTKAQSFVLSDAQLHLIVNQCHGMNELGKDGEMGVWVLAADEEDIFLLPVDEGDDWVPKITSGLNDGAIRMTPGADIIELPGDDVSDMAYYEMADSLDREMADIDRLWDLFMDGSSQDADLLEDEVCPTRPDVSLLFVVQ